MYLVESTTPALIHSSFRYFRMEDILSVHEESKRIYVARQDNNTLNPTFDRMHSIRVDMGISLFYLGRQIWSFSRIARFIKELTTKTKN
jgi:hypothetical protein